MVLSFVSLGVVLRDPLWFNDLNFTTKGHNPEFPGSQRYTKHFFNSSRSEVLLSRLPSSNFCLKYD